MKVAVVVQRYGHAINGGAELHARYIAERLARHAAVEVLTTCAVDYVTWKNDLAEGGPDSPGDGALACWTRSVAGLQEALSAGQAGAGDVLRVVDVCAHLLCNRVGVSLVTEAVLRELAAKAIEAMHSERN